MLSADANSSYLCLGQQSGEDNRYSRLAITAAEFREKADGISARLLVQLNIGFLCDELDRAGYLCIISSPFNNLDSPSSQIALFSVLLLLS